MIDKKLEENIKKTRDFMDIWNKFHDIFRSTVSADHVDAEKEKEFLSIKSLVSSRYEDLMDSLGVKPLRRFIINASAYNIFSIDKLSIMSDVKLAVFDRDWLESSSFLKTLYDRLGRKKRRIENFNKFAFVIKKGIKGR